MKHMPTIPFVFAVLSLLVIGFCLADEAACERRHAHNNFYDGLFEITPSETTGDLSWLLTVTFSRKISHLEVWRAKIVSLSDDGKTFVLKNKDDNYQLEGGKTVRCNFRATLRKGKGRFLRCLSGRKAAAAAASSRLKKISL